MKPAQNAVICASCSQRAICRKLFEPGATCEHWPLPVDPSLATLALRAGKETAHWIAAGAKIVPADIKEQRAAICHDCPHWNHAAYLGTGSCGHPSCHCTRAKLALATSKCPMDKWMPWIDTTTE